MNWCFWCGRKTYEEIVELLEPWVLACAVGAYNGSVNYGSGHLTFNTWLQAFNFQDSKCLTGASKKRLTEVLTRYAQENQSKHMLNALDYERAKRSLPPVTLSGSYEEATANRPDLRSAQ